MVFSSSHDSRECFVRWLMPSGTSVVGGNYSRLSTLMLGMAMQSHSKFDERLMRHGYGS